MELYLSIHICQIAIFLGVWHSARKIFPNTDRLIYMHFSMLEIERKLFTDANFVLFNV